MSQEIISFQQALEIADKSKSKKKHLLLGNGFSVGIAPQLSYGNLRKKAELKTRLENIFQNLYDTSDFELVINSLNLVCSLSSNYLSTKIHKTLEEDIRKDTDELKEILINTIVSVHPEKVHAIEENKYHCCQDFLRNFKDGKIYTTNYDLILYWSILSSLNGQSQLKFNDGFSRPKEEQYELLWNDTSNDQTLYFLHGGLHLFDDGKDLRKLTWVDTGIPLKEQISGRIRNNVFPLFISESTYEEKYRKIRKNLYLYRGLKSLASIQGSLFVYGHGLKDNDQHILEYAFMKKPNISNLFIGVHGDQGSDANQELIQNAENLKQRRNNLGSTLEIIYFDSESANVWGKAK